MKKQIHSILTSLAASALLAVAALGVLSCSSSGGSEPFVPPEGPNVPVASITLTKNTLSLKKGQQDTISVLISPSNATNKSITWVSVNTDVASVPDSGSTVLVTARGGGETTVTAIADGGKKTALCKVYVAVSVDRVEISSYSDFNNDNIADLTATTTLTNAARAKLAEGAKGHTLRLSPASTDTDGFFIALYERT